MAVRLFTLIHGVLRFVRTSSPYRKKKFAKGTNEKKKFNKKENFNFLEKNKQKYNSTIIFYKASHRQQVKTFKLKL